MPVVFVHGVPDTYRVWDKVRAELKRSDAVALSLPGFGGPLPAGFVPTKEAYAEWLADEFRRLGGGLDVVGHDWGSLIVLRAVMLDPAPIRSWCAGGAPLDASYEWHAAAKAWQTPGVGEKIMAAMNAATLAPGLMAAGLSRADADETAKYLDNMMKDCMLTLYRSGVYAGAEWGPGLGGIRKPGLVLWGARDPFAESRFGELLAGNTRAKFIPIDSGHWYQVERPREVALALKEFWNGLD